MKLTMVDLENYFGARITWTAKHLSCPGFEMEDLIQDLLIKACQEEWEHKPTYCYKLKKVIPVDPAHVNNFLFKRAQTLRNSFESRRRRTAEYSKSRRTVMTVRFDVEGAAPVLDILRKHLTPSEYSIVEMKITPPTPVECLANRERLDALEDRKQGKLKMNVHALKVSDKHIAQFAQVSPATLSRVISKARAVLAKEGISPNGA